MKTKSKKSVATLTVHAFGLENGFDRRTVSRRLKLFCIKPHKVRGRYEFFRVSDLRRVMEQDLSESNPSQTTGESAPDLRSEHALRERIRRQREEIALAKDLEQIAPLDICRRILTRGAAMLKTKLLNIPDRTSELFALETDSLKIRERLIAEIADALRSLEDGGIEKLIKNIFAE